MKSDYKTITLSMFGVGVNCYLLTAGDGYILIDTGFAGSRKKLVREMEAAGCMSAKLKLILLTHGDSDHAGNAKYLREIYGAKIAMHRADAGMVEQGDMLYGRSEPPTFLRLTTKLLGLSKANQSSPDLTLEDGQRLEGYGVNATVLHLPGHSAGSLAVLTDDGVLFAGDLVTAMGKPIVADAKAYQQSIERIKTLAIHTLCPGHGKAAAPECYLGNL